MMTRLAPTPSQTIGPYFGFALPWADGPLAVAENTEGAIRLQGAVFDGAGAPVPDCLVETWQADPAGRYAHPDDPRGAAEGGSFRGFARCAVDEAGRFSILTLKPGPVPGPGATTLAPHVCAAIFARGLLSRLVTRIYFADEEERNHADPVLAAVGPRAPLLLASPVVDGYRFDIRLQGEDETPFFAI